MNSILSKIDSHLSKIRLDIEVLKEIVDREESPIDMVEASRFTGKSVAGIRYLISKNIIPYHLPNGTRKYKFFKSELISWIKGQKQTPPPQR